MGRYPYMALLNHYLKDRAEIRNTAITTQDVEARKLKELHDEIQILHKTKRLTTTNPKNLTENDINEIIRHLNTRPKKNCKGQETDGRLDQDTIAKYMQYLSSFLVWAYNPAMARMKELNYLPRRSAEEKPIESLDQEDTLYLIDESQTIPGWEGEILAFTIPFFIVQGLRPQELHTAEIEDIDTRKWRFFIRHPKGGLKKKWIKIYPPVQPHLIRYLEARERELTKRGVEYSKYLFPSMTKTRVHDKPYSSVYFRRIKKTLEAKTKIRFDYRKLRRTSGQYLKDQGIDIEKVSKHLRHSSTRITEKYYARMRDEEAENSIGDTWSQSPFGKGVVKSSRFG